MINKISLNLTNAITNEALEKYKKIVLDINKKILSRNIEGQEFLDFLNLEIEGSQEIKKILKLAKTWTKEINVLLVIAPYSLVLHSKAIIEFYFGSQYKNINQPVEIIYLDHILTGKEMHNLTSYLDDKNFAIHVISKTGNDIDVLNNLEIFSTFMEQKIGTKNASKYICVTTNPNSGSLKIIATQKEYELFAFLDKLPEVYSFFSSVSLISLAICSIDINKILSGAKKAISLYTSDDLSKNISYQYALARNLLKKNNIDHEVFINYENSLESFGKYWQYIFSETHSKENRSLYIDIANYSKEISTRSQFIQEGYKKNNKHSSLFLTILSVGQSKLDFHTGTNKRNDVYFQMPSITQNQINLESKTALINLHQKIGHLWNIEIYLEDDKEETIGYFIVFLQTSSLMSAYLSGVNPFESRSYEIYNGFLKDLLKKGV